MTDQYYQRRLTAILSADVAGYSLLMRDDETATVRTITTYRNVLDQLIQQYRGRVVDSPGDNMLAEFHSVVDAVNCAVEIQRELAERNAELQDNRKMRFRVGVNLGDVIVEEKRIYGDGVNIAARMESLADIGGICISGTVYDAIEEKIGLEYEFMGKQEVKNMDKPIRAYRVLSFPGAAAHRVVKAKAAAGRKWRMIAIAAVGIVLVVAIGSISWNQYLLAPSVKKASNEETSFALPAEPSIAVMPFANMSNDPKQDYFCYGIADQIINSISKIPYIMVIARNSSFSYKDKFVNTQQIARDLKVRYILEGSLQRHNENVRISAQLIDAEKSRNLWSENYDRKLDDIFSVQDEICKKIMVALQVKLTIGEMARMDATTIKIKAYEKFLKAQEHYWLRKMEEVLIARRLAQEATVHDPQYAAAYLLQGWTYLDEVWFGTAKNPSVSISKAEEMVQKAIAIEGITAGENGLLSSIHLLKKDLVKSISHAEQAIEENPSSATFHHILGMALNSNGQYEEAIVKFNRALQLNPNKKINYLNNLAWACLFSGQYDKAISTWNKTLERNPDYLFAYMGLSCAYWFSGSEYQARQAADHVLRINPRFSVAYWEKRSYLKDKALRDKIMGAWRQSGLN